MIRHTRALTLLLVLAGLVFSATAGAQIIKRVTVYNGALRIVDTPDNGASYEALSLGAAGTGIFSTNELYIAPGVSDPASFFRGYSSGAAAGGLYVNSGAVALPALEVIGNSATNPVVWAAQQNAGGYAGYFGGDVEISGGDLEVTVSKTAEVQTRTGNVFLHALESPEVKFVDYGLGELVGGTATVSLDPVFAETIEPGYQVYVTAIGAPQALLVTTDAHAFTVHGQGNAAFTYEIVATRKGFDGRRF